MGGETGTFLMFPDMKDIFQYISLIAIPLTMKDSMVTCLYLATNLVLS